MQCVEFVFRNRKRCARDDHVRGPHQTLERLAPFGRRKVQGQTALSGIKELVVRAGFEVRHVAEKRVHAPQIVARGRLNADYVVPLLEANSRVA